MHQAVHNKSQMQHMRQMQQRLALTIMLTMQHVAAGVCWDVVTILCVCCSSIMLTRIPVNVMVNMMVNPKVMHGLYMRMT